MQRGNLLASIIIAYFVILNGKRSNRGERFIILVLPRKAGNHFQIYTINQKERIPNENCYTVMAV